MVRKTLIALAAAAALSLAFTPTAASARGGHGGGFGGMHGGPSMHAGPGMRAGPGMHVASHVVMRQAAFRIHDRDDFRDHRFRRHHRFALLGAPYLYDYDYGYGCYQPRRVQTYLGWQWRRVNVCY